MMHTAVLCMGSNVADAPAWIDRAVECLISSGCTFRVESDLFKIGSLYTNFVAEIETEHDYTELRRLTKEIELRMGRTPALKRVGVVPIDIDVVIFDDEIMRFSDFDAPYFQYGYATLS